MSAVTNLLTIAQTIEKGIAAEEIPGNIGGAHDHLAENVAFAECGHIEIMKIDREIQSGGIVYSAW